MTEPTSASGPKLPPSYPPKTPPPPKRPVEPPRPNGETQVLPTASAPLTARRPVRMSVRNRRAANWTLIADKWAVGKAVRHVTEAARAWGYAYPQDETLAEAVELLVAGVLGDGGRRVSMHLADQDDRLLILALSHQPDPDPADDEVLTELATVAGTVSCGTDAAADGRRVWMLMDTSKPRTRASAAS